MTEANGRVLVVSPSFFGYEHDIVAAFGDHGVVADYVDERASNSAAVRAVLRVRPATIAALTRRHFARMLRRTARERYAVVLVVKGEVVTDEFLAALRQQQPDAVFLYYTYDSVCNSPRGLALQHHFDLLYSFDRADTEAHQELRYKPLFFSSAFQPGEPAHPVRHAVSFVGTLHSGRYQLLEPLFQEVPGFFFFFVQARWYFHYGKYVTREFADVDRGRVSFDKLDKEQVAAVFRDSGAVLDIQRRGQSGLTMRTFEALASGARLVTSNAVIREEPFYDPRFIHVVDDDAWSGDAVVDFLRELPAHRVAPPGFEHYSVRSWVGGFLEDARNLAGSRTGDEVVAP